MRLIRHTLILLATLTYPVEIHAADEDPGVSMFSLHGFGTLDVVHADERNADFAGSAFQPDGAGFTRRWAPDVDSKLGLQGGMQVTGKLSAIVQIVSQHRYDDSWRPQIEWANIKYELTPDLSIRAGRSVAAPFMLSDTRLVAYTYPWVRPPTELYGELPVTNIDGVDIHYRLLTGGMAHSLSASYGQTNLKFPGGGDLRARNFIQASDTMEAGFLTFRIGYTSLRVQTHFPSFEGLFSGFAQFSAAATSFGFTTAGAQAAALGTTYSSQESSWYSNSIAALGATYDPGKWLVMSEWSTSTGGGLLARSAAWYVMGGYRMRQLTPYVTVGQVKAHKRDEPGISTAGLPPPLGAGAAALNGGLDAVLRAFAVSQSSAALGVRWDVAKNIDLKLQYDRVRFDSNSNGRLINVQPEFRPDDPVNVLSLAMDFVF